MLLLLGVGAAIGLGGGGTYAAFSSQATSTSNTIAAHPDWLAPPLTSHALVKTSGGVPNFVKPGGTFRVCGNVGADPGNPATGLKDVIADLGGQGTLALTAGSAAPCTAAHTHQSASVTATSAVPLGQTTTVNVVTTVRDNGLNATTVTTPVVIDNDPPAPSDVTTTNGGILNKPDAGDTITFAFDEPIDPDSIIDGWDGVQPRTTTVSGTSAGGGNDRLAFSVPIVAAGSFLTIRNDYVTDPVDYAGSTIVAAGSPLGTQYRVTLGTMSNINATRVRTSSSVMTWATSGSTWDRAGNAVPALAFNEPGLIDTEF
jgi:predicted ribosomally synthesized peptide with SipW-like signal peptide